MLVSCCINGMEVEGAVDAPFMPEMLAAVSHHFLHILNEIPDIGTRPLQSSRAKSAYIRNHYYSILGQCHN